MPHLHLLVRAEVRRPLLTTDAACEFLRRAVALAGMQVIGGPWGVMGVIKGNEGPSAVAILDYSSTDLHSWPDAKPWPLVHFSLYSCGKEPSPAEYRGLLDEYGLVSFAWRLIDRDAL